MMKIELQIEQLFWIFLKWGKLRKVELPKWETSCIKAG